MGDGRRRDKVRRTRWVESLEEGNGSWNYLCQWSLRTRALGKEDIGITHLHGGEEEEGRRRSLPRDTSFAIPGCTAVLSGLRMKRRGEMRWERRGLNTGTQVEAKAGVGMVRKRVGALE
jgi:hypothetical protein